MNESEMDAYLIEEARSAATKLNDLLDTLRKQGLVAALVVRRGEVRVEDRRPGS